MDNHFETTNGWQFRVNDSGNIEYRFQDDKNWQHLGTQLALGFVEWARSDEWWSE